MVSVASPSSPPGSSSVRILVGVIGVTLLVALDGLLKTQLQPLPHEGSDELALDDKSDVELRVAPVELVMQLTSKRETCGVEKSTKTRLKFVQLSQRLVVAT